MTPLLNCLLKRVFFFLFLIVFTGGKAQFYNLPNDYSFSLLTERGLAAPDSAIHTGLKPYIHFFSKKYIHVADSHRIFKYINDDPAIDLVFYKHFFRVEPKKENFKLRLDPVLNLEFGKDFSNKTQRRIFTNTRGVIASGYIGDKVYVESLFAESQSVLPEYSATVTRAWGVVPGQGRWKQFKTQGFDYAFSSGFVSIQALKNLNIQVGHGKHKIGSGYRSLLLSDNSFNYPYAKITQQWFKGRVQYSNIYSVFMNMVSASKIINPNTERLFQKKAASFQYLSVNLTKKFNLSFFQGMIWQAGDERNKQHLTWHYFNPVIYTNLLSYGLDNKNNIVTGLDAKYKLGNKINVYAQLMLDKTKTDSSTSRWGWQGGINYFDVLGVKNLFLQVEYNHVKQESYLNANTSISDQSYSHYNQTLAYTPGSGDECVVIADYKVRRFFFNFKYNYQQVPINLSDPRNFSYVNLVNVKAGYVINPAYNLNVAVGMVHRTQNFSIFNTLNNKTNYLYVAIRTSLYNLYYDF